MNLFQVVFAAFLGTIAARLLLDWLKPGHAPHPTLQVAVRTIGGIQHGKQDYQTLAVGDSLGIADPQRSKHGILFLRFTTQKVLELEYTTVAATPEQIAEAEDRRHPLKAMREAGAFATHIPTVREINYLAKDALGALRSRRELGETQSRKLATEALAKIEAATQQERGILS